MIRQRFPSVCSWRARSSKLTVKSCWDENKLRNKNKSVRRSTEMSKFTRKNKEKNIKKKKKEKAKRKLKFQEKSSEATSKSVPNRHKQAANTADRQGSITSLNLKFRKLKASATPQAIVRAKLKRDQRLLEKEMKDLCKDVKKLFKSGEETNEEDEEGFAAVENLSKNVSDLIISNENNEPGFRYTRWQQRKFTQKVRDQKIKYKYEETEDENM